MHFMHTLAVQSGNLNFLEGCYHMYSDGNNDFPVKQSQVSVRLTMKFILAFDLGCGLVFGNGGLL